jgi:hypothetical protein
MSETNQPCPVCPEGDAIPLPVPARVMPAMSRASQVNYVIGYDGPAQHVFHSIAASIPPGEGRPEDRNGSLEFTYEHPEIDGYTRDPNNPRLQHPTWPPCTCRSYKVALKNKVTMIAGICHHLTAKLAGKTVLSAQCQECPSRVPPCERKPARSPAQIIADFMAASRGKNPAATTGRIADSTSHGGQPAS